MNNAMWVMYAGMVCWGGIGLYLFLLTRKQRALTTRLNRLAQLMENEE